MKRIILNFEKRDEEFKELVQEAFNQDILNFLISKETYSEFKDIERLKTFSKDTELDCDYVIYENKEELENILLTSNSTKRNIGYYKAEAVYPRIQERSPFQRRC